jgi:hypothetical protein
LRNLSNGLSAKKLTGLSLCLTRDVASFRIPLLRFSRKRMRLLLLQPIKYPLLLRQLPLQLPMQLPWQGRQQRHQRAILVLLLPDLTLPRVGLLLGLLETLVQ